MRRRDLDDEPVMLLDEDGREDTRTVELRPTFRREWLLVVAAVAVVLTVGLISDGGAAEPEAAPATTTTSAATTTTVHRRFTARVRRWTQPTTSTATPPTGPVAPFPTGTAVAGMDGQGRVLVFDLDTGAMCTAPTDALQGVSLAQYVAMSTRAVLVQTGRGMALVDPACQVQEIVVRNGSYALAVGDRHFWTMDQNGQGPIVEHDLATGLETGRSTDVPSSVSTAVTAGDRLVLGIAGDMTEVLRGAVHEIGPGNPTALSGATLASVRCAALHCRLEVIDLDSGERRVLTPIWLSMIPWSAGTFSPDGSLLIAYAQQRGDESPTVVLIDVASGKVRVLPREFQQAAFTIDGSHLIATTGPRMFLLSLDGVERWPIPTTAQGGLVAMPRANY